MKIVSVISLIFSCFLFLSCNSTIQSDYRKAGSKLQIDPDKEFASKPQIKQERKQHAQATKIALSINPNPIDTGIKRLTRTEYLAIISELCNCEIDKNLLPKDLTTLNLTNRMHLLSINSDFLEKSIQLSAIAAKKIQENILDECTKNNECIREKLLMSVAKILGLEKTHPTTTSMINLWDTDPSNINILTSLGVVLNSPIFLYRLTPGKNTSMKHNQFWYGNEISHFLTGRSSKHSKIPFKNLSIDSNPDEIRDILPDLASPEIKKHLTVFFKDWLGLTKDHLSEFDEIKELGISKEKLLEAMNKEVDELISNTMFGKNSQLASLFNHPLEPKNKFLKQIYKNNNIDPTDVKLKRRGILGTALFFASHSRVSLSVFKRALFVREQLLCQKLPDPPEGLPDMMELPPDTSPGDAIKKLKALSSSYPCSNCHQLLDIGFAFEAFDGIGKLIQNDNQGDISDTIFWKDSNISQISHNELIHQITSSREMHDCFALQLSRFAMGRELYSDELNELTSIQVEFFENGGQFYGLIQKIVTSNFFKRGN